MYFNLMKHLTLSITTLKLKSSENIKDLESQARNE